jgi:hypothetical protein
MRAMADRDIIMLQRARNQDDERRLAELIKRMNARYAVVNEAGKAVIYEPRFDPVLDRMVLVRIEFEALRKFYMNQLVTITRSKPVTKSEAEWWLQSPQRRQYLDGVVFDPTNSVPPTFWNLWSGFAVEPRPGDWSLMLNHIYEVICGRNDDYAYYVLSWLARMFQQPNKAGEVALVLRGKKGSGKGIFGQWIRRAWGAHGIHITNAKHLVGNFNAHLRDCVFLFADEAFYAGDKQHEGVLKGLVTEPSLPIEGKYQNVITVVNMLHILMASNSDWVVPATHDERRYAIFDVSDDRVGQIAEYFVPIAQQMERGGLAAMIYEMLKRDISHFEVRNFPHTAALAVQKKHSLDSLQRWWIAVLERGFLYESRHGTSWFAEWHDFYTTELLWHSYTQWCDTARPFDRKSRVQLGVMMSELYVPSRPRDEHPVHEIENIDVDPLLKRGNWLDQYGIVKKEHMTGYFVNDLHLARAKFAEVHGISCEQGEPQDEQGDEQGD